MMMKNAASLTEGEHEFLTLHFVSFFSFFYRFSSALLSGWRFRRSSKSPVHLVIWSVISSICEALWQYDWSTLCEGKGSERSAGRTFIDCLNPEGDGSTFCSHPVTCTIVQFVFPSHSCAARRTSELLSRPGTPWRVDWQSLESLRIVWVLKTSSWKSFLFM